MKKRGGLEKDCLVATTQLTAGKTPYDNRDREWKPAIILLPGVTGIFEGYAYDERSLAIVHIEQNGNETRRVEIPKAHLRRA